MQNEVFMLKKEKDHFKTKMTEKEKSLKEMRDYLAESSDWVSQNMNCTFLFFL